MDTELRLSVLCIEAAGWLASEDLAKSFGL